MPATMTARPRTDRADTIRAMLSSYREAQSEAFGGGGSGGRATSRINAWDPTTWTMSYQELERVLDHLKYLAGHGRPMIAHNVSSSAAWWAIKARYLDCEIVRREVFMRRTHSGDRVPASLPRNQEIASRTTILNGKSAMMLVRVWNPAVDQRVVDAAVVWIAREYRGTPSVYREVD